MQWRHNGATRDDRITLPAGSSIYERELKRTWNREMKLPPFPRPAHHHLTFTPHHWHRHASGEDANMVPWWPDVSLQWTIGWINDHSGQPRSPVQQWTKVLLALMIATHGLHVLWLYFIFVIKKRFWPLKGLWMTYLRWSYWGKMVSMM